MYMLYGALAIGVCVLALLLTLIVGKDVNKKIKHYEIEGDLLEDELARSSEYETSSIKRNVRNLNNIYIVIYLVVIFVSLGFVFFG